MVDVVAERGYGSTEIADVIERAGVTRGEFDARFENKEDCALQTLEAFIADFEWRVTLAYERHSDWRTSLRAAAYACADWMEASPNVVRFGVVGVMEMESEMARVRREAVFTYCGELIDNGRAEASDPSQVPENAAILGAGSIMQLLTHRMQKGAEIDPPGVVPEMMYLVVRPYVGETIAREELTMLRPEDSDSQ